MAIDFKNITLYFALIGRLNVIELTDYVPVVDEAIVNPIMFYCVNSIKCTYYLVS